MRAVLDSFSRVEPRVGPLRNSSLGDMVNSRTRLRGYCGVVASARCSFIHIALPVVRVGCIYRCDHRVEVHQS